MSSFSQHLAQPSQSKPPILICKLLSVQYLRILLKIHYLIFVKVVQFFVTCYLLFKGNNFMHDRYLILQIGYIQAGENKSEYQI